MSARESQSDSEWVRVSQSESEWARVHKSEQDWARLSQGKPERCDPTLQREGDWLTKRIIEREIGKMLIYGPFFCQHFVYVLWAEINEKFALRADHVIYPTLNIARIVNAVHVTFWLSATNPRCQLVHYGTVSQQKPHFFGHCPNYPTQSWFSCSQLLELN